MRLNCEAHLIYLSSQSGLNDSLTPDSPPSSVPTIRVIQAAPYRYEPQLNLYAGLLVVLNSSESHTTAMAASASSRNIRRRQSDSPS